MGGKVETGRPSLYLALRKEGEKGGTEKPSILLALLDPQCTLASRTARGHRCRTCGTEGCRWDLRTAAVPAGTRCGKPSPALALALGHIAMLGRPGLQCLTHTQLSSYSGRFRHTCLTSRPRTCHELYPLTDFSLPRLLRWPKPNTLTDPNLVSGNRCRTPELGPFHWCWISVFLSSFLARNEE